MGADVSSLYLLDRDGEHLTLAATNGLDRYQIGRAVVPVGEGITGRVAASREPIASCRCPRGPAVPVGARHRPAPVRGVDALGPADLARPGRGRPQRADRGAARVRCRRRRPSSSAIADLLASIVEKGRLQREAEAQVIQLKALDQARNELIALVTHELRTPLAVVRAYTDLLAEEPPLVGRSSRDPHRRATRAGWHAGRSSRSSDSIGWSTRSSIRCASCPDQPPSLETIDLAGLVGRHPGRAGAACSSATAGS